MVFCFCFVLFCCFVFVFVRLFLVFFCFFLCCCFLFLFCFFFVCLFVCFLSIQIISFLYRLLQKLEQENQLHKELEKIMQAKLTKRAEDITYHITENFKSRK